VDAADFRRKGDVPPVCGCRANWDDCLRDFVEIEHVVEDREQLAVAAAIPHLLDDGEK